MNLITTFAEFVRLPEDGKLHELDDGELIVRPPRFARHGIAHTGVLSDLRADRRNGIALGRCGFRLGPDTVLAPADAFISAERSVAIDLDRYCEFGPDLAVEILSPDDKAAWLLKKIGHYLAAGTKIVWVLDPEPISLTVYETGGTFRTLEATDHIDAPELLPGFSTPVSSLFE